MRGDVGLAMNAKMLSLPQESKLNPRSLKFLEFEGILEASSDKIARSGPATS